MKLLHLSVLFACLWSFPVFATDKVQEVKAGNTTAWLIEDHSLPVITVRVEYPKAGAAYDPKGQEGIANFTLSLLDEGAGDKDALSFTHAMENYAIRFSAEAEEDNAVITLQTMSEFREQAFFLLILALQHPRFDAEAIERVRANTISTLRQAEQNPTYILSREWKKAAFIGNPYAHPKIGSLDSITAITRENIVDAYKMLGCQHPYISVTGDISPAALQQLLPAIPNRQGEHCERSAVADIVPQAGQGKPIIIPKSVAQTLFYASLPALQREDPRYYTLVVINYMLGGSVLSSRLGREIRDKRGLAYYADSDINTLDHANWLSMHFATRADQAGEGLKVFLATLADVAKQGFSTAEIAEAKSYLTGSFALNLDSQNALTAYLSEMQKHHLGRDYLQKRNHFIEEVTSQMVNSLTELLIFDKNIPLIIVVGNLEEKKEK